MGCYPFHRFLNMAGYTDDVSLHLFEGLEKLSYFGNSFLTKSHDRFASS